MVKIVGQKLEEAMITARQLRHEAFHHGELAEKSKEIGRDERLRFEKQVDELVARQKSEAETLAKTKEQEIVSI